MHRLLRALPAGLALGAALLAGCRHTEVVVPAPDNYYPVALGTYRTYAVEDSTYTNGVGSVRRYQQRERVERATGQFTDAAGLPAYRVVRSRRATTSDAWVDDSVLTVQPLPQLVLQTRGNVRTVELVYPVARRKTWNQYAFTVNSQAITYLSPDTTIASQTRRYAAVDTAYTTPAISGQLAKTYPSTVITADILPTQVNDKIFRRSGRQQVFAKDVGPVRRHSYYYERFTQSGTGPQTPTSKIQNGNSHLEVLLETGLL